MFSLFETSVNGNVTFAYIMFYCTSVLCASCSMPLGTCVNSVILVFLRGDHTMNLNPQDGGMKQIVLCFDKNSRTT